MSKVSGWLGWGGGPSCGGGAARSTPSSSSSRLLVSVYVQRGEEAGPPMPRRRPGLSRASRRVLLTTSIWSVLVLVFAFFFTYTVLLFLVDRPFLKAPNAGHGGRQRVRFFGRDFAAGSNRSSSSGAMKLTSGSKERHEFWDPKELDDPDSVLPDCKIGALFVVVITSSVDHFQHRREIRNSWCDPELSSSGASAWQCVFLIGQTEDANVSSWLRQESQSYGDIVRGSYLDSYRNLTMKVLHGLAWMSHRCDGQYLLKTDDDCFVNSLLLWQFLVHFNTKTSDLYAGNMVTRTDKRKVIRTQGEKWSVSKDDYLPEYYPMYASGGGYAISFDAVMKAVELSKFIKPIANEDAYIGIVMDRLGVPPTLSGRFTLSSAGLRVCNFKYIFVTHGVVPSMQQKLHKTMMAAQTECESEDDVKSWY